MSAQLGSAVTLTYWEQGAQQAGGSVQLSYSPPPAVSRKLVGDFGSPWARSSLRTVDTRAVQPKAETLQIDTRVDWYEAQPLNNASTQPWGLAQLVNVTRHAVWSQFAGRPLAQTYVPWGLAEKVDHDSAQLWGEFEKQLERQATGPWGVAKPRDAEQLALWGQFASHIARSNGSAWSKSVFADQERWNPWNKFSRTTSTDWSVVVIIDDGTVQTTIVPVQRVYIVINNASLRRVDGNIFIPTFNMSLNLDADSWTWGFSASLPDSTLASIEPASSGAPVEVELVVNGIAYRALIESISRSRSFGKSSISVQGRGKTALLDSPYAPVSNFSNSQPRTAQQLMGDVLTVNAVPMDWAVDWQLTDWSVPAGVFSHQGSYISALNSIAGAVGGYIQPHASLNELSVLPRYPSTPWSWASRTPDFELPAAVTVTEGISWVEKARYNRVFVSGVQQGVLGQVTRTGTAGDLLAPMITDQLITHADAARQRGLTVLANTGRQATVSLKLPVLAETGIITPGKFVRYVDGATTRVGIVRSVGVEIGSPDIFQTLGIETHVN